LQFRELAEVWNGVSTTMQSRTAAWLYRQIKSKEFATTADDLFQLLALFRNGDTRLRSRLLRHADEAAGLEDRPFYRTLVVHALLATGEADLARRELDRLRPLMSSGQMTEKEVSVSLSHAYGLPQRIELLGWYLKAYLQLYSLDDHANAILSMLTELKGAQPYLSTQARIQYLGALIATARHSTPPEGGRLRIWLNEELRVDTAYRAEDHFDLPLDWTAGFRAGAQVVRLAFSETESPPAFNWQLHWRETLPPGTVAPPLALDIKPSGELATVGDPLSWTVQLRNTDTAAVYAPMAIVGLPGNCRLLTKPLDQLVDRGLLDFYEREGPYLHLYWQSLAPAQVKTINVEAIVESSGVMTAPVSVAYPYYQPTLRHWLPMTPLTVSQP